MNNTLFEEIASQLKILLNGRGEDIEEYKFKSISKKRILVKKLCDCGKVCKRFIICICSFEECEIREQTEEWIEYKTALLNSALTQRKECEDEVESTSSEACYHYGNYSDN